MKDGEKHHYIPVFYLKQWAGADGRLCEFSRPYDIVKPRRTHPDGTGYIRGLYTIPGLPPEDARYVEHRFMKATDDWAAQALEVFRIANPSVIDLGSRKAVGWARFLYSLMVRNPEQIEQLKREAIKREMNTPVQALLPELINSEQIITAIASMNFHTIQIAGAKHSLLTSDRPIIMTNVLAQDDAHIVIPLSPTQLFVAVKSEETWKTSAPWTVMPLCSRPITKSRSRLANMSTGRMTVSSASSRIALAKWSNPLRSDERPWLKPLRRTWTSHLIPQCRDMT